MKPGSRGLLLLIAASTVMYGGCHLARPAPPIGLRPAAVRAPVFAEAMQKVGDLYVDPERAQPATMLEGALEELAAAVSGAGLRKTGDARVLTVSGQSVTVVISQATDLPALAAMLDACVTWLAEARPDIPVVTLRAAGLRGAVQRLDRWSTVASGKKKEQILDSFSGTMAGVGCKVGRRGDEIAVIEVYPGTPAANAGLREEDRIIAIDGESTSGRTVAEIADRLRGPAGSSVRLGVRAPGREQPQAFEIERQRFVIPTVRSKMVGPGIGYLRVSRLSQNSGVVAERALRGIREDRGLRGLVLDLRGNSGGSMLAAGRIADQFVSGGMLIETRGAHGTPVRGLRQIAATANPDAFEEPNLPVVVLVDKGTGSSAELLAATLAWHDRAVLVGQRTYGKPVMQKLLPIGDDLLLKLTVARSYAAGRPVPESGLQPDVIVAGPDDSPDPARCTPSALDCEDAAAAVLPAPAGDADPELSVAVDIIARHPLGSRARLREAIANSLRTL